MAEEKRVVLVKPGDVLVIGNLGTTEEEEIVSAIDSLHRLGLSSLLLFAEDIQIDAIPREQLAELADRAGL